MVVSGLRALGVHGIPVLIIELVVNRKVLHNLSCKMKQSNKCMIPPIGHPVQGI